MSQLEKPQSSADYRKERFVRDLESILGEEKEGYCDTPYGQFRVTRSNDGEFFIKSVHLFERDRMPDMPLSVSYNISKDGTVLKAEGIYRKYSSGISIHKLDHYVGHRVSRSPTYFGKAPWSPRTVLKHFRKTPPVIHQVEQTRREIKEL